MLKARQKRNGAFQELIHHVKGTFVWNNHVTLRCDLDELGIQSCGYKGFAFLEITLNSSQVLNHMNVMIL